MYKDIAYFYHNISPDPSLEKNLKIFFLTHIPFSSCILDCTCGNGLDIVTLKQIGYNVSGSDISQHMLERAYQNALDKGVNISFSRGDMLCPGTYKNNNYDTIISIGNSLPHLSIKEVLTFFSIVYKVLPKGGKLLITFLNHDLFIKNDKSTFFFSHKEHITFFKINFLQRDTTKIIYFDRINKKVISEVFQYTPFRYNQILYTLQYLGFSSIRTYGNFLSLDAFDINKHEEITLLITK